MFTVGGVYTLVMYTGYRCIIPPAHELEKRRRQKKHVPMYVDLDGLLYNNSGQHMDIGVSTKGLRKKLSYASKTAKKQALLAKKKALILKKRAIVRANALRKRAMIQARRQAAWAKRKAARARKIAASKAALVRKRARQFKTKAGTARSAAVTRAKGVVSKGKEKVQELKEKGTEKVQELKEKGKAEVEKKKEAYKRAKEVDKKKKEAKAKEALKREKEARKMEKKEQKKGRGLEKRVDVKVEQLQHRVKKRSKEQIKQEVGTVAPVPKSPELLERAKELWGRTKRRAEYAAREGKKVYKGVKQVKSEFGPVFLFDISKTPIEDIMMELYSRFDVISGYVNKHKVEAQFILDSVENYNDLTVGQEDLVYSVKDAFVKANRYAYCIDNTMLYTKKANRATFKRNAERLISDSLAFDFSFL